MHYEVGERVARKDKPVLVGTVEEVLPGGLQNYVRWSDGETRMEWMDELVKVEDVKPQSINEEMIQRLMAIWPGKLPHKRAKVKLEYAEKQGCLLCSDCTKCPKVRECPILDPNDVKED